VIPFETQMYILAGAVGLYIISSLIYAYKLATEKSVPDMVILVDSLTYDLAVFIVALSILTQNAYLAVGALPLAIWAYVFDIYMSKYLEGRELGD